jgi:hypothetical protein
MIEPMYFNMAINLNPDYNPDFKKDEPFSYQINMLCSKVIVAVTPQLVKDLF